MKKPVWKPLMTFGLVWLFVVLVSWFAFPDWGNIPGGFWTLAGLAAVGALAFLKDGVSYIKTFLEIKPEDKQPGPPAAPSTSSSGHHSPVHTGAGNIVLTEGGDVIHEQHLHLPPASEKPHDAIGYVPAAKAETYVKRGIEVQVLEQLRNNGAGAIVGVNAPGGQGKTELAKQVCETLKSEYEILWVDVGEKTPAQVAADMLLRCGAQTQPGATYEQQINELRHAFLQHKFLVILDDVRQPALPRLADFLPPRPNAALVTSRIQQMGGVRAFPLDKMTPEQARELLRAILGDEGVAREQEMADRLAERCAFNPLALEIAARRARQESLATPRPIQKYFELAQARFAELRMDGDERWDMQKVFDVSYLDLDETDRRRFRALAAFHPTGFAPEAAARLWGEESPSLLARFINLSLVMPAPGGRYRLHDLLDEYASAKLAQDKSEENAVKTTLAEWLADLYDEIFVPSLETLPIGLAEKENLLHTCAFLRGQKDGERLARLTTRTNNWFNVHFKENHYQWLAWLEACLQIGIQDKQLKANVLQAIGDVQNFRDERDAALESYQQALGLFRAVGARLGEANVLSAIGQQEIIFGSKEKAQDLLKNAINIYTTIGDRYSVPAQIGNFGWVLIRAGRKEEARPYLLQAAELFEKIGLPDYAERHRKFAK